MDVDDNVNANEAVCEDTVIVDIPFLNDVVFRQGTRSSDNPGNSISRDLIMNHFEDKDARKRNHNIKSTTTTTTTAEVSQHRSNKKMESKITRRQ